MHDGILIGIGTAVNDNPQLNGVHLVVISACGACDRLVFHFSQSVISHFRCRTRTFSTTTTRALLS